MRDLERYIVLQTVDARWREHLESMDYMREGIHLRGMAQKDPLVEYRNEGHVMFTELNHAIREEVIALLFHAQVEATDAAALEQPAERAAANGNLQLRARVARGRRRDRGRRRRQRRSAAALAGAEGAAEPAPAAQQTVVKSEHESIGRNDPCWCGSGKKYKRCHGA